MTCTLNWMQLLEVLVSYSLRRGQDVLCLKTNVEERFIYHPRGQLQ